MYFFGFFPPTNENMKKNLEKIIFLGRIFLFIQIAYIILVKGGFVKKILLILLKTVKNTSFIICLEKKYIVAIFKAFCLFFDENNEIRRKSSKNSLFL